MPYADGFVLNRYVPSGPGPHAAIVFLHGGGWTCGVPGGFDTVGMQAADRGYAGFSIQYLRYKPPPDHVASWSRDGCPQPEGEEFPRQVDQVGVAVEWIREHASELDVDPSRIVLLGASAGGHLAAMYGVRDSRIMAVIGWSGIYDLRDPSLSTPILQPYIDGFLGCDPVACPERAAAASPVTLARAGDPSWLLLHHALDDVVPLVQATNMTQAIQAQGGSAALHVFDEGGHSESARFLDPTWVFLESAVAPRTPS